MRVKKQRIFFEGLGLVDGHFSGIGQYNLGILRGVDQLLEEAKYTGEPTPEVRVIIPRDCVGKFNSFGFKNIGYKRLPLPFYYVAGLWHRGKMFPLDLWCGRGFYFFPRFVDMPLLFSKSAMVIFDISFELYKQFSDERNARFLSKGIKRSLKRTSKVITISKNAKREIVDFYRIDKDMVAVATPAVDLSHFYKRSPEQIAKVKEKYGISGDYILALSNLEPRKNLDGLVDAYCSLPKSLTDKNALLLVGVNGWKIEDLFDKVVGKVEQGYNIIRPSKYVADEDKPAIISGAKLLVYPSHYEGFGMPPLEALACGVPVITANNSSLPEVVGKIGTMVDSNDTPALAKAIESSIGEFKKLSEEVQVAGPEQAEKFSWIKSAQTFLDVASGKIK
jgi:glycosyltransferase involved in cell wall biosynthesis